MKTRKETGSLFFIVAQMSGPFNALLEKISTNLQEKAMENFMGNMMGGMQQQQQPPPPPQQPQQYGGKGSGRPPRKDVSQIQCFKCGEFGHYANTCQNGQRMASYPMQGMPPPPQFSPAPLQQMVPVAPGMVTPMQGMVPAQTTVCTPAELAALAKIDELKARMDLNDTEVSALKTSTENAFAHLGKGLETQTDTLNNTISHMENLTRKVSASANDNALAASVSKQTAAQVKLVRDELTAEHDQRLLAQKRNFQKLMEEISSVKGKMNWAQESIQMQAKTLQVFRGSIRDLEKNAEVRQEDLFAPESGDEQVDSTSQVNCAAPETAGGDDEVVIVEGPSSSSDTPATSSKRRRPSGGSPSSATVARPISARVAAKMRRVSDGDGSENQ